MCVCVCVREYIQNVCVCVCACVYMKMYCDTHMNTACDDNFFLDKRAGSAVYVCVRESVCTCVCERERE